MKELRQREREIQKRRRNHTLFPLNLTVGAIIAMLILSVVAQKAAAQESESPANDDSQPVTRIEEDWRLVIGTPNEREHAPQIVTVLSPSGDTRGLHAVFELNHSTLPEYLPGGMQLQAWSRDYLIGYRQHSKFHLLATPEETIKFTSSMTVDDGTLTFKIVNGTSQTWGAFGGTSLKLSRTTTLNQFDAYQPELSVRNSSVGFASHRVRELVLTEVRYYSDDEQLRKDTTVRVVHRHQPED